MTDLVVAMQLRPIPICEWRLIVVGGVSEIPGLITALDLHVIFVFLNSSCLSHHFIYTKVCNLISDLILQ